LIVISFVIIFSLGPKLGIGERYREVSDWDLGSLHKI